jgi:hypothetical protein
MFCKKFCNLKYIVAGLFGVMALVAFNLGQPGIQTDNAIAFNDWYQSASGKLLPNSEISETDLNLHIKISARDPSLGAAPTEWILPASSLREPEERENTGRVLQLIRESNVFGFTPISDPERSQSVIALDVKDGDQSFSIAVPYNVIEKNIQLKNLLKLLDVYSTQKPANEIEVERL